MTMRKFTLLGITSIFICLIVILFVVSRFILLKNLEEVERENAHQNVERVLNALSYSLLEMETIANDWAAWDDTYKFINDVNSEYIESNLIDDTLIELRLDMMIFADPSGQIIYNKMYGLTEEEETIINSELTHHLYKGGPLLTGDTANGKSSGILIIQNQCPLLVTSSPILTSLGEGPARGTLICTRCLEHGEIQRLNELMSLTFASYRINDTELPDDIVRISPSLSQEEGIITMPLDSRTIAGYAIVEDIYGEPGIVLKMEMPRDIYREGQTGISYLVLIITGICAVFGLTAGLIADKMGLSRLKNLARNVEKIGKTGNASGRIPATGNDEISLVANSVNNMLAAMEKNADDLKEKAEQLQTAVAEAQSANRAKSEFLSGVSHELRTPLTSIIGLTQLLEKQYYGELNEKQLEYVRDIIGSSDHLLSLINDILDLARIESGKSELEIADTQVKELMESSLLLVQQSAAKKKTGIKLKIPEEVLELKVAVDSRRIKQVMVNLLSNAIKFTPDRGKITIEAEKRDSELEVRITDNGIGISPEDQKRIFDAFYQVQSGTKDKTPGTGLGLSLVKDIVEKHLGQVWVESEGIGSGSRFSFTIPMGTHNRNLDENKNQE